jgi:hypothetical protein
LKKSRRTTISVPTGDPASETSLISPALTCILTPASESPDLVTIVISETEAMLGSASPRNPRVRMENRSDGGVALERHQRVVPAHALAVVNNPDQAPAALLDLYHQPPRSRVQGVLHQLLDHRSRPLHHLAGGDLVGHFLRQQLDFISHDEL